MLKPLAKKMEASILNWINVDRYLPLQIDITNACNLRCKHCYHPHHQNTGAIELADWINVLDQYEALIKKLHFRPYVIICGGEPLLSRHFEPVLENLLARGWDCKLSVLTNGTIHDAKKTALLKKFKDITIQVSLDGPSESSHDSVRGQGNFQRTLKGIQFFVESGIAVNLLAILSKRSAPLIGEFFDLARSLNVGGMGFTRLILEGHAKNLETENADRPLQPFELREAYKTLIAESARSGIKTSTRNPLFHLVYSGLGRNGRYWEGIVIDYQGKYLASSRSRLVLGHAIKDGIENIFLRHPLLKRLRRQEVKVCGTCPHYAVCGGDRNAAYAATGDFLGADPGCWLLPRQQTQTA